jgi:hypothetical protein
MGDASTRALKLSNPNLFGNINLVGFGMQDNKLLKHIPISYVVQFVFLNPKQTSTMAVLHNKEQKIEDVLSQLPKKYSDKQFVEKFIQLYSKDWGKIKANYIKQSQDKEPGTIITMPKPELYLKSILETYLSNLK